MASALRSSHHAHSCVHSSDRRPLKTERDSVSPTVSHLHVFAIPPQPVLHNHTAQCVPHQNRTVIHTSSEGRPPLDISFLWQIPAHIPARVTPPTPPVCVPQV